MKDQATDDEESKMIQQAIELSRIEDEARKVKDHEEDSKIDSNVVSESEKMEAERKGKEGEEKRANEIADAKKASEAYDTAQRVAAAKLPEPQEEEKKQEPTPIPAQQPVVTPTPETPQ